MFTLRVVSPADRNSSFIQLVDVNIFIWQSSAAVCLTIHKFQLIIYQWLSETYNKIDGNENVMGLQYD